MSDRGDTHSGSETASERSTAHPSQLEKVIQVITDEVLRYLGGSTGTELDEELCLDCDQHCVERCVRKTQRVIAAGADRISARGGLTQVDAAVAPLIDHTLLKPDATQQDIRDLCRDAVRFGFASVVVNPWYVPLAAELVRGSPVKVCTVVGFPLGATLPPVKIFETEEVIKLGAQEVDMVINIGALRSGQDEVVEQDIRGVVDVCHRSSVICKVILETALLGVGEKVSACVAAKNAGADFVKTSTGFGPGGATPEDVALMRAVVGTEIGVKAAGGIRSLEDLEKMVSAGATRIGASASVKIMEQAQAAPGDLPPKKEDALPVLSSAPAKTGY